MESTKEKTAEDIIVEIEKENGWEKESRNLRHLVHVLNNVCQFNKHNY